MSVAVYPGSFDPVTNGHLDVIRRATAVFDRVIVAVLANPRKTPLLSIDQRVRTIELAIEASRLDGARTAVEQFDGLTVEFCRSRQAGFIVRGLRAVSDFETEMQLAHNNRKLAPSIDTVFFMTSLEHGYVSSSLVKEIAQFDGDVSSMIPEAAEAALREALRSVNPGRQPQ
jgi:pantetheine-phosphate adenylyltransferase